MEDHRKLGRELGLFGTDPLIGAGLPFWLPAGAVVRHALEEYLRELEQQAGYQHVYSPVLGKRELYELSGHWSHYRDGMYPPMELGPSEGSPSEGSPSEGSPSEGSREQVVLRPSLCPHHALLYRSRGRSYRELPLRLAELGGQYRAELSGVLGGLTRVRAMQLNDGHVFCTADQAAGEARGALAMIRQAYAALGIEPVRYRLSLPGPGGKYTGDRDSWDRAAAMLAGVLDDAGLNWESGPGEAAFYGPKIDVQVADAAEREATLSTVQVDFYQPEKFGLQYAGPDGSRHRPVMVHRSVMGSMERVVAHLLERHGGAFPDWLAPEQVVVLPVTGAHDPAAAAVARQAAGLGLRARVAGAESGTLGRRIRSSRLVPYQAVIGDSEAAAGQVAVRLRDGRQLPPLPADVALAGIAGHVAARRIALWDAAA
jgi:threonyl-tRNA synthetase